MPSSSKLTTDGIVFLELVGEAGLPAVEAELVTTLAPGVAQPAPLVMDARKAHLNPSGPEVREHAEFLGSLTRSRLLAPAVAIVAAGMLQTGIANMLSTHAEFAGVKVRLFEDLEEAFAWARAMRGLSG
jgi:hypothetical protein